MVGEMDAEDIHMKMQSKTGKIEKAISKDQRKNEKHRKTEREG